MRRRFKTKKADVVDLFIQIIYYSVYPYGLFFGKFRFARLLFVCVSARLFILQKQKV